MARPPSVGGALVAGTLIVGTLDMLDALIFFGMRTRTTGARDPSRGLLLLPRPAR